MRRRILGRMAATAATLSLVAVLPALTGGSSAQAHDGRGHSAPAPANPAYKNVGYFTQWGIYARNYQVKNVETSGTAAKLTHLNYAFANIGADGKCFEANVAGEGDAWADYQHPVDAATSVDGTADTAEQPLAGNFNQLRELKAKNPKLKVLISIGGWGWSTNFSNAALTPASRTALVASCLDIFIKGNLPLLDGKGGPGSAAGLFDGVDIDWEWPASSGDVDTVYRPQDKKNFTALAAEFRKQLDAYGRSKHKHYDLSAFLPAAPAKIDAGFEVKKIFKYLDFGTVQGYDFHGPYEATTNQQSALKAPRDTPVPNDFSDTQAVGDWLHRGAPARRLVLGIPFYGQGWTGVPDGGTAGLFQPSTGPAPATWQAGNEDYHALKALAQSGTYAVHRDTKDGFAWLYDGTNFWTYDDPQVVTQKTAYIKKQHLGGAMAWSLDGDTSDGELMTAIDTGLNPPPPHHGHH
ncbi:glycoside hydrolase family 18 protein [Streptomyces sp. NBC_01476]|uniref:glycoside hydrolase family 18 protein n=1 Tax=Streptomyces sp. NBC_01476 TaxID=2903881 RepID=UPI002E314762|nr:glycoside hydrolase family 18 protein [Streptomyces sp. NBC_01476]